MPIESLRSWLIAYASIPAWGIFLLMVVTLIKTYPIIQRNLLDARERRESRYSMRITELEAAVRACQEECEDHKNQLREEINHLNETLSGLRRQHVQEQISLVAAIIESVDNPVLKQLMNSLKSVQRALPAED